MTQNKSIGRRVSSGKGLTVRLKTGHSCIAQHEDWCAAVAGRKGTVLTVRYVFVLFDLILFDLIRQCKRGFADIVTRCRLELLL